MALAYLLALMAISLIQIQQYLPAYLANHPAWYAYPPHHAKSVNQAIT